jgi:hypothetical protein
VLIRRLGSLINREDDGTGNGTVGTSQMASPGLLVLLRN